MEEKLNDEEELQTEEKQKNKEEAGKLNKFIEAPEVEKIAKELIYKYHQHLSDLAINYSFRTNSWSNIYE